MTGFNYSSYINVSVYAEKDNYFAKITVSSGNNNVSHYDVINDKLSVLASIWYQLAKIADVEKNYTYMQGFWEQLVRDKTGRDVKHPRELVDELFAFDIDINCNNGVAISRNVSDMVIDEKHLYIGGLDGMRSVIWKDIL